MIDIVVCPEGRSWVVCKDDETLAERLSEEAAVKRALQEASDCFDRGESAGVRFVSAQTGL